MQALEGKVALVTGAARGIGRATAELLSEQGAHVLVGDLDGDAAQEVVRGLPTEGAAFAGDITKPEVPERLVQAAVDAFGKLDIVVNNAGYALDAPAHKLSDDWFQRMLDIHLVAPFRILRAAAPHLREPAKREREQGVEVFRKIVNVSSTSGTMGNPGQANYAAGKAGIVGVTKTLAKEWGQFRINVNAVAFAWIDTRMIAVKDESNTFAIDGEEVRIGVPAEIRELAATSVPIGRPGTPREAADAIFLLCSPWSNFINGQVLTVSGGTIGGMSS
jgi:3-oxoacyl-[acyl-carrier protein] reductase